MMIKNKLVLFLFFFSFSSAVFALNREIVIKGRITDSGNQPIEYAAVYLEKTSYGTTSDEKGSFSFAVPPGRYWLVGTVLGYDSFRSEITVGEQSPYQVNIKLADASKKLEEVVVHGKSAARRINETAYNVSALDTRLMHNSNLNVSDALAKVSGIRLRETGGVGSDMAFSLNGFSGKHVKVFMDGAPMEGFGSSFQINNIPVGMAERIEVYKGVVPVSFGADALGGVVNIVTRQGRHNYLDVSYSFGSFHTHKSNVNFSYTLPSGWTFRAHLIQNYSKNDYPVYVHLTNSDGVFEEKETKVNRFHDAYRNEAVVFQTGLRKKRFAERLLLGVVVGHHKADIQTGNHMDFVYGEKFSKGNTVMPTLDYQVRNVFVKNLSFGLNANYHFGYTENVDTASYRKYTWKGDWKPSNVKGESSYQHYQYRDHNGSVTANLNYKPNTRHAFTLNNVYSTFHRQGEDLLATDNEDNFPGIHRQNVAGLNYMYSYSRRWNTNLFVKHYSKFSRTHVQVGNKNEYFEVARSYSTTGYGLATTVSPAKGGQVKFSYEKAYRLPTSRELFGNNDLELGNDSLRAEHSNNFNLNYSYDIQITRTHRISAEVGLTYRDVRDYIRRKVSHNNGTAASVNEGKVRNMGISTEVRYAFANLLSVGANITYQDIRNRERYANGKESLIYNDRMPNTPYLFGNVDAVWRLEDFLKRGNTLSLGYNMQFLDEYYLNWASYGSKDSKSVLPAQLSHDINVTYQIQNGRYNISLECINLTNERLYDNYSLQKPGRSFTAKFRYYIPFK